MSVTVGKRELAGEVLAGWAEPVEPDPWVCTDRNCPCQRIIEPEPMPQTWACIGPEPAGQWAIIEHETNGLVGVLVPASWCRRESS